MFLFCSYFGTDQSQVQRYLTTPSVDAARESLLMSAYWKIPLQALVLLVGVLMFLFYLFTPSPMLFNQVHEREMRDGPQAADYRALESPLRGGHGVEVGGGAGDGASGGRRRRAQLRGGQDRVSAPGRRGASGSRRGDRAGAHRRPATLRTAT